MKTKLETEKELAYALIEDGKYEEALPHLQEAATLGDVDAMNDLGVIYHNGYLGEKDFEKAKMWYLRAAERNNTYGVTNLFRVCHYTKDIEGMVLAARLISQCEFDSKKEAAELYYTVGKMLYFGEICHKDYEKAGDFFLKALELGYDDGYYLANICLRGLCEKYSNVEMGIELYEWQIEINEDKDSALDLLEYYYLNNITDKYEETLITCEKLGINDAKERLQKHLNDENYDYYN